MSSPEGPELAGATGLAGYRRIEIELRKRVAGGQWAVGAMLPGRRDLARQYAVSLVTLDRAIGPLLADGTLRADDRRGTFVASRRVDPAAGDGPPAPGERPQDAGTVGIVASLHRDDWQPYHVLHELEHTLSQQGRATTVRDRAAQGQGLAEAIRATLAEGVQALLVICLDIDRPLVARELSRVAFGNVPTVCILAGELNLPLPHVFYDNRSGGYQAAQHLLDRGWSDLVVVAPFTAAWVEERIAGVRDAVAHAPSSPGRICLLAGEGVDWDVQGDPRASGYRTVRAALRSGWRLSGGVVAVNDGVAFGVLDAASEAGLRVGQDFALLGFDDDPLARTLGLTSLRPPMPGMAREAARLLLDHGAGDDGCLQVRLRAQIIPRASTRPRDS